MFGIMPYRRNNWRPANIFRDMDEFERSVFGNRCMPAFGTDVTENEDSYLLQTDLPGFSKEEIKIDVNDNVLTISAEHNNENEQKENDKYVRRERSYGKYTRSFEVEDVDLDNISAKYENGVLTLTLPKKPELKPQSRSISID